MNPVARAICLFLLLALPWLLRPGAAGAFELEQGVYQAGVIDFPTALNQPTTHTFHGTIELTDIAEPERRARQAFEKAFQLDSLYAGPITHMARVALMAGDTAAQRPRAGARPRDVPAAPACPNQQTRSGRAVGIWPRRWLRPFSHFRVSSTRRPRANSVLKRDSSSTRSSRRTWSSNGGCSARSTTSSAGSTRNIVATVCFVLTLRLPPFGVLPPGAQWQGKPTGAAGPRSFV